ncbi:putative WRKY transcription factor 3 [Vitis vinifera]|uniref:Putative WRKY transcription factor 3 n=1 Tax=Vitis vinifera TaxID=29760 RepID=A0A438GC21_VITVI|nr:putative WRKY transcription factor 3 [Vitis vinifera]
MQGPFVMSHQQALAQVTAQAAQAHSHMQLQAEFPSSLSVAPAASLTQFPSFASNTKAHEQMPPLVSDTRTAVKESSGLSQSDQRSQPSSFTVDKPTDDGYNWRKYGQKQVKGKIIYKGQHNHQAPLPNKRAKDTGNPNGNSNFQENPELASQNQTGNLNKPKEGLPAYSLSKKDQQSSQAIPEHLPGSSDSEEMDDAETRGDEKGEDEPDPKRRNTEVRVSDQVSSHRTVTEPRIIVQTTSEVDLLDDGYRWRKYGQKVVKGNPYPRWSIFS